MGLKEHKKYARENVTCAVITVSSSRTEENDTSGRTIIDLLKSGNHLVKQYAIVTDDTMLIRAALEEILFDKNIQAVILNGGTGISTRDVTVEAVKPLMEKELDGFGELFRNLSHAEIGSAAMPSRAFAGVGSGKIIFCLPGSTGACKLAMEALIIPELGHIVHEIGR